MGVKRGRANPCTYFHSARGLKVLVHGDDFVGVGDRQDLEWFMQELQRRFDINTAMLGLGEGEAREGNILNRVIRVDHEGWHYEADQRHAEIIVSALGLENAKAVVTPGEDEKPWEHEENQTALTLAEASTYRALVARCNYLAMDRADLQYAVKELCKAMSNPTIGDKKALKRVGRYLIGRPRMVQCFE